MESLMRNSTDKIQDLLFNMAVRTTQNKYFHQIIKFQNLVNKDTMLGAPCLDVFVWKDSVRPNRWINILHEGFMHHDLSRNLDHDEIPSKNPQIGSLLNVNEDFPRLRLVSINGVAHPFKAWRNREGRIVLQTLVIRSIDIRAIFTKLVRNLEVHEDCPDLTCHNSENTRKMVIFNKINISLSRQIKEKVDILVQGHNYVHGLAGISTQDQRKLDLSSPDVVD